MRSSLFLATFGLLGCVSLPHARLVVIGEGTREVVTGPVVCGPVGFRKVPLQSRWGEYVRVTVAAPSMITGTVLVHANGIAQEPRTWSTESGALIIDAQFPNLDPDARYSLVRERPIDITLTGLSAPNGGTCEGAVFTVEQGALVPSVDERAWIAELERRGGPELAARREHARVEAEARRQAHYAAWEARQQIEVGAEVVAQAEVIRQAHYAQWEARQVVGGVQDTGGAQVTAVASVEAGAGVAVEQDTTTAATASSVVVPTGVAGSAGYESSWEHNGSGGGAVATSGGGTVVTGNNVAISSVVVGDSGAAGGAVSSSSGGGSVVTGNNVAISSVVVGSGGAVASGGSSSVVSGSNVAISSVVVNSDPFANPHAVVPGSAGYEASFSGSAEFAAFPTATTTVATVNAEGEWSQPSDVALRSPTQVSVVQPSDVQLQGNAQVQTGWEQPYQPRLDAVPVSTESQVATGAQYNAQLQPVAVSTESQVVAPVPPPCGRCRPPAAQVVVDGAALFNLMLNVGAAAAGQAPQQPVHGAQPVSR